MKNLSGINLSSKRKTINCLEDKWIILSESNFSSYFECVKYGFRNRYTHGVEMTCNKNAYFFQPFSQSNKHHQPAISLGLPLMICEVLLMLAICMILESKFHESACRRTKLVQCSSSCFLIKSSSNYFYS